MINAVLVPSVCSSSGFQLLHHKSLPVVPAAALGGMQEGEGRWQWGLASSERFDILRGVSYPQRDSKSQVWVAKFKVENRNVKVVGKGNRVRDGGQPAGPVLLLQHRA